MSAIRIAAVRYLNTVPLIHGLHKLSGVEMVLRAPAEIAPLVAAGRADLGLASVIDAARAESNLALVPVGMIGCDGPTLTVRVFSADPIEQIGVLHADVESHTSVGLARVLLARRYGREVDVRPFNHPAANGWPTNAPRAVLLIGDKVVTAAPPADRYPYQLDLGEAWHEWTGLPFVYAVWMCRRDEVASDAVRVGSALLARQRRHNLTRLRAIVGESAPEHGWPTGLAERYLGSLLRYTVGAREREAVARFHRECAAVGLVPPEPPVWGDEPESAAPQPGPLSPASTPRYGAGGSVLARAPVGT